MWGKNMGDFKELKKTSAEYEVDKAIKKGEYDVKCKNIETDNIKLKHQYIKEDEATLHQHIMEEIEAMKKAKITVFNRGGQMQ
jgi:translation initiation factor IF-3